MRIFDLKILTKKIGLHFLGAKLLLFTCLSISQSLSLSQTHTLPFFCFPFKVKTISMLNMFSFDEFSVFFLTQSVSHGNSFCIHFDLYLKKIYNLYLQLLCGMSS